MKSARASDTPRQEQKQSTVVLKSRYEIMIVTTENPWQLPGPIWSFFFSTERGHFAIVRWCRGIFSYSKFLMSDPASPLLIWVYLDVFSQHIQTAAQNVASKSHSQSSCPGVARAEQPQRRRDKLPVSTCMRPAETENSGGVNYLARRASPCCSHRRARLQMLRHLRRAVEEPLAARPRCSSDDSAQTHVVGSARGSQLSCKKVFVEKERKNIWLILKELELILWILFWIDRKEEGPRIANKQL